MKRAIDKHLSAWKISPNPEATSCARRKAGRQDARGAGTRQVV